VHREAVDSLRKRDTHELKDEIDVLMKCGLSLLMNFVCLMAALVALRIFARNYSLPKFRSAICLRVTDNLKATTHNPKKIIAGNGHGTR
jgi:hypothetical protein